MADTSPYLGAQPGAHAIERAWERYGVSLTPADLTALALDCAEGRAPLVRRNDREGSEIRMVRFQGVVMLVGYWPNTRQIATILPPERARIRDRLEPVNGTMDSKKPTGSRAKHRPRPGYARAAGKRWEGED